MNGLDKFLDKYISFKKSEMYGRSAAYQCKKIYDLLKFFCEQNAIKPMKYSLFRENLVKKNILCKQVRGVYYISGVTLQMENEELINVTKLFYGL